MSKAVKIQVSDLVVFEGIAKTGEKIGQPYAFARLDQRFSNNSSFVKGLKENGVKVISDGTVSGGDTGFEFCEE